MIYKSLLENDIIDGIVQDPENPGVDLDAVEKAIAGEDGIAAHQDEVEAAEEGLIGEPIEEFASIIYESEYNYNQIMEAIGMAELREAAMGRELVLEGVDLKGFFKTIKDFFVNMFKRITQAIQKVLAKMDFVAKADKAFARKNKSLISLGLANAKFEVSGYKQALLIDPTKHSDDISTESLVTEYRDLKDAIEADTVEGLNEQIKALQKSISDKTQYKDVAGLYKFKNPDEFDSIEKLKSAYKESLFGEKGEIKGSDIKAETIIGLLEGDRETKAIRDRHAKVKTEFKKIIDQLNKYEAKFAKGDDSSLKITAVQVCVKSIKETRAISNAFVAVLINLAQYRRSFARKVAHEAVAAAKEKGKYNPKNESGSLFDSISLA